MEKLIKAVLEFSKAVNQAAESTKKFGIVFLGMDKRKFRHFKRYQRIVGQK